VVDRAVGSTRAAGWDRAVGTVAGLRKDVAPVVDRAVGSTQAADDYRTRRSLRPQIGRKFCDREECFHCRADPALLSAVSPPAELMKPAFFWELADRIPRNGTKIGIHCLRAPSAEEFPDDANLTALI
jgi:hypothetical protein